MYLCSFVQPFNADGIAGKTLDFQGKGACHFFTLVIFLLGSGLACVASDMATLRDRRKVSHELLINSVLLLHPHEGNPL